MTRITIDDVLSVVREHGPITKTEVAQRISGINSSPRIEKMLGELKDAKRVTLKAGISKNGRQRNWVYEVCA